MGLLIGTSSQEISSEEPSSVETSSEGVSSEESTDISSSVEDGHQNYSETESVIVQIVENNDDNNGNNRIVTEDWLPETGEKENSFIFVALSLIVLGLSFILAGHKKENH
ncbi:LPXTG cell wall anchor domain-containing protein [Aerococcaceae bacterium DSM 111020]|nr:LPXTG cell wall anchor domain-containing protein [Aerococcaceae bacterium DSM 111020]